MAVRPLLLGLITITLSATACRKSEVTSYRVPKEKDPEPPAAAMAAAVPVGPPAAPMAGDMASAAVPTASGQGLTWSAPAHWKVKPPAPMRKATYAIPGEGGPDAELSITAFPGDVGGELANLNRWRGQPPFQLPPITPSELATAVTRRDHEGLKFGIVELESKGTPGSRLLGAWVAFAGSTWFFKLTGPDAVITKEKAAFLAFLDSVTPATAP
jgi:hypothetical protein